MEIKSIHVQLISGDSGKQLRYTNVRPKFDYSQVGIQGSSRIPLSPAKFCRNVVSPFLNQVSDEFSPGTSGAERAKELYRRGRLLRIWNKLEKPAAYYTVVSRWKLHDRIGRIETVTDAVYCGPLFGIYVETDSGRMEFYGTTDYRELVPENPEEILNWLMSYNPISMRVIPSDGSAVKTYRSVGDGVHCFDFSTCDFYSVVRNFLTVYTSRPSNWLEQTLSKRWDEFCNLAVWVDPDKVTANTKPALSQGLLNHIRRVQFAEPFRHDRPAGFLWRGYLPDWDWDEFYFTNQFEIMEGQ